MQRALDFDKTPALGVPLPFLLNVPLFGLLAGLLATWAGPQAFLSRWDAATLALTHLWTLGILGSAMLGASIQILAVACNVPIAAARPVARTTHALLTLGTLALAGGFLWWSPTAWLGAIGLLAAAFALYLLSVGVALWRHRKTVYKGAKEILVPVRGALAALGLTVLMGLVMAGSLGLGLSLPAWVGSHILWGLLGWGGLLLMAMSFQLLPIFQLTELYPKSLTRWLPLLVPGLLVAWSALDASSGLPHLMRETVELLLVGAYLAWIGTSLQRLWARKRPTAEATTLFWFTSLTCLLACAPAWVWLRHGQALQAPMVLGVLLIVGGLGAVVHGMLYKIVPFLLWKHAQDAIIIPDRDPAQVRVYLKVLPKMAEYIPVRAAQAHWACYTLMTASWLLAAAGWAPATRAAGPLLLLSAALLAWNLGCALRRYRKALRDAAALPHHQITPYIPVVPGR
ncbi:hypothetical protein [Castellaniella caeni]|uniref:hypothetical protein n=1 Tax=Castellaniella caeni TaxID=266123 RepID=UPI000829F531|nr:hypothetical protein [Castellaniella caeni]